VWNTANGHYALYYNNSGKWNTANGYSSLFNNTSGDYNTVCGNLAGFHITTGGSNTAIGNKALYSNIIGITNTALGDWAYYSGTDYHNSTALGNQSSISASNQIRLGNSSVTSIGGYANWTNVSDARFKTNIKENIAGLEFIMKLRPVSYNLDMDAIASKTGIPDSLRRTESEALKAAEVQTGFIAQEVEQAAREIGFAFHGVDVPKNENDFYGLRYSEFVVPLVKAMQEQQSQIEQQNATIESQNAIIDQQQKMINSLAKRLELIENQQ